MNEMRRAAQQLAAQGRFGDSVLLHVSPAEVEGIASLIPGGLTTNPRTGLPEAFFFLPFLASLFGAAAPAAAAATAAAPALAAGAGAAAAGAAAAAPALAGAAGLGALGAPTAAMTAGTLASAAPAVTAAAPAALGIDALTTGSIGGVGAATPAATAGGGIASTLPATMTTLPTSAQVGLQGAKGLGAVTNPAGQSFAGAGTAANVAPIVHQTPTSIASTASPAASALRATPTFTEGVTPFVKEPGGIGGLFEKMGGWKNMPLMLTGLSAASNALGGLFKKKEKGEKKRDISKLKYDNSSGGSGAPVFPGDDYRPGFSGEHNYFPNYQYANGGIVSLAEGGMVDPQMQPPQDMSFPMNGVPAGAGTDEAPMLEDIPSSPYPSSQIGSQPEPPAGETVEPTTNNDRELVAQTVEAIQGKVANPGPILLAFVQEFGEPALQDLAQRVKAMPPAGGPPMQGMNDGQSDSIPALIDGKQPAALSEGEFVVPADAVSGLGNGSTDAGAQQLQGMVDGVRQMRTGGAVQPPPINPRQVMPYAGGGLVSLYAKGGKVSKSSGPEWSWADFFNPLSGPPGSNPDEYPTWGEVVVPPPSEGGTEPPGLWEFLNPFSEPPGSRR